MRPRFSESSSPRGDTDREKKHRGQYMVEFAMAFSIFVIFVLIVIDLGLLIYNHNLFYHGVSKAARVASLGGTDVEIRNAVVREVVPNYFPTMLLVANPDTGVQISPGREMHRVDGVEVSVRMDARFGMSMLWFGNITINFPIRSSSVVIQNNDEDRDGCKDELEGTPASPGPWCDGFSNTPFSPTFNATVRRDHFNDRDGLADTDVYLFGASGPNADIDADSTLPGQIDDRTGGDSVVVGYFEAVGLGISDSYAIYRPISKPTAATCGPAGNLNTSPGSWLDGTQWEDCFDGSYHAPELWSSGVEHPAELFPRRLPVLHVEQLPSVTYDTRVLNAAYDWDNDGWEDKYDEFVTDPTRH